MCDDPTCLNCRPENIEAHRAAATELLNQLNATCNRWYLAQAPNSPQRHPKVIAEAAMMLLVVQLRGMPKEIQLAAAKSVGPHVIESIEAGLARDAEQEKASEIIPATAPTSSSVH